jgi:hypothetical protein
VTLRAADPILQNCPEQRGAMIPDLLFIFVPPYSASKSTDDDYTSRAYVQYLMKMLTQLRCEGDIAEQLTATKYVNFLHPGRPIL